MNLRKLTTILLAMAMTCVMQATYAQHPAAKELDSGKAPNPRLTPVVRAVAKAVPSVVSIGTEKLARVNDGYDTFFHEFYGRILKPRQKVVKSYVPLGSGIIISTNGLILTNLHVVRRANNLEVRLWNGKALKATIVGFDNPNDLAMLRITDKLAENELTPATFAKPDDLYLGETVITIGNPFGLDHSVSQGVLSALKRSYADDSSPFNDLLQTDAAINPGNSGGPLVNLDGNVIGINQAIRRGASGIGFAIPTKRIEQFAIHWLLPSRFSNAYLGLNGNGSFTLQENGIKISDVYPHSPADRAGLHSGDVITKINGKPMRQLLDFGKALWSMKLGQTVAFTLSNNEVCKVTLENMPDSVLIEARLGLKGQNLTPAFCEAIDLPKDWKGLVINEIIQEIDFVNQQAEWRKNLKRGDIIVKIDDTIIESDKILANFLRTKHSGQPVLLYALIYDANQSRFVFVKFETYLK